MNKPEKYIEVTDTLEDILKKDGLSLEKLKGLSYHSNLGIRLKKNLHYFDKNSLYPVADMSKGKAYDDGYRGIHIYYQLSSYHYPIEIQYNTYYDRQLNNWLHKYVYKRNFNNEFGCILRKEYESGKIKTEKEFLEVQNHVLLNSKEI